MTSQARPAAIRPAREDDLGGIESILLMHDGPPTSAPPLQVGAYTGYLRHLLARGQLVVAEAGPALLGFGASVDTGRATHLSDLFVLPDLLGEGIGRQLLEPLFANGAPRTTFASDDPRAMNLYVGLGMTPYWPNLYLTGTTSRLPANGVEVADVSSAAVAELELAWTGVDRSADYRIWGERTGNRPFVARAGGRPVAAGQSRPRLRGPGRWLDRLIPAPDADDAGLVAAVLAALRHAADDDGAIGACVMGPNPALRTLLVECGFRIADRDTFMATDPALLDPRGMYDTGNP